MNISDEKISMADKLHYIIYGLWDDLGHPEAKNYFWLHGPWLTWLATAAYLYIVLKAGPDFMRNRKPYDLKLSIRLYNLILVIINTYLFIVTASALNLGIDCWGCTVALDTRRSKAVLDVGHLFFHTRYLEFFDTFFFVLRKKTNQITFLHVFHHGIVPTLMYIGLKFYPVPFNALLPLTNMIIHVVMYAYYGLATFGPGIQKYLWWKKYLTTLQISQFVLLIIHCSQPLLFINRKDCNFPFGLIIINYSIGLTFLLLFLSFYRETYGNNKKAKVKGYEQSKNKHNSNSSEISLNGKIDESSSYSDKIGNICKLTNSFNEIKTKEKEL